MREGSRGIEGEKEHETEREGERERKGASGSGLPGGSRLLLLLSLSNFPSFAPSSHLPHFICLSLLSFHYNFSPCLLFSPTFPFLHFLYKPSPLLLSLSFPLFSGLQCEDRLLANGCFRGERASESLMRCLSPPSRLDQSSQQRITTTTTPHSSVRDTVSCLPAWWCCCCSSSGNSKRQGLCVRTACD